MPVTLYGIAGGGGGDGGDGTLDEFIDALTDPDIAALTYSETPSDTLSTYEADVTDNTPTVTIV